ncbi:MAG: flavodoxin family protein [Deltaproteobacteria bacterium]|nr:flavodoxin family protein [Deltaproteobacteria bacterium]
MTNESKKVLILLGSPRKKGNSAILAQEIAKGAEAAGARVESLYINGMDIKACQACWTCQKKDTKGCAIDDDMQSIFPKLIEADAWVIASPVHWFNVSTQTKLWFDRCFALTAYGKNPFRKKIGIAMSYGDTDPYTSGCINAIRSFQDSFRYVGAKIEGIVYGSALNAGDISQNTELLKEAEKLGEKLAR